MDKELKVSVENKKKDKEAGLAPSVDRSYQKESGNKPAVYNLPPDHPQHPDQLEKKKQK